MTNQLPSSVPMMPIETAIASCDKIVSSTNVVCQVYLYSNFDKVSGTMGIMGWFSCIFAENSLVVMDFSQNSSQQSYIDFCNIFCSKTPMVLEHQLLW